ncbi:MAG: hypothetical protein IAI48_10770 [Candidatus Eremiobacteraeota bacterium]|nr:hypothetical protein [Candidatus Eremiobacteraeota bacterium]
MSTTDAPFVIEETELDLEERSGPSPWLVLGIIGVILALVFGVRGANKRRLAKREAIPTDIGDIGDPNDDAPAESGR